MLALMKVFAASLATATLSFVLFAYAEESLPPGLTRSGGVIMMQPIGDSERSKSVAYEHRPGAIRVLSSGDRDLFTRAFEAAYRSDWALATSLAAQGHDPTARKLIEWRRVLDKNSGATFSDIDSFLKANPQWPLHEALLQRAEAAISPSLAPAGVVAWFGTRQPASALARVRLGEALLATGQMNEGRSLIREAWRQGSFELPDEVAILQKDGTFITRDDDRVRVDNLLWRDLIEDAKRELPRLAPEDAHVAEARIQLRLDADRGLRIAEQIRPAMADTGLVFDRARAERHLGKNEEAEMLLLRVPSHDPANAHPLIWWSEFNAEARQALEDRNYHLAYALASATGLTSGEEYAEAEFLAGWIALRRLSEPAVASSHFERVNSASGRPISRARAHYWLARALEAEGNSAGAAREYSAAAQFPQTFYGQLSQSRIDPHPVLDLQDTPVELYPVSDFDKEDLTQAMKVLADLGEESLLRAFAARDLETYPTAPHAKLLADRLADWGFREIALRIAKEKSYAGVRMFDLTHPVIALPPYRGAPPAPEPALVLGLIRQETEFDPSSVSGPGARGLMQLMPEAAGKAAQLAGLPYRPADLLTDPAYNMQLGMTELADEITYWGGSYVLSAAAYNAGKHNVEKWITTFGDPRRPGADPVDWIEQIPFTETRNYVQRVLENTEVYRSRLAQRGGPLQLRADLYRPNPAAPESVLPVPADGGTATNQTAASPQGVERRSGSGN